MTTERDESTARQSSTRSRATSRKKGAAAVARTGAQQLAELTGRNPEAVTALSRTEDGWQLEVEVLEIHRVPETADVLAVYQADLDENGELLSYRRLRRYTRAQVREE